MTLEEILKSGEIKNEKEAEMFVEHAEFEKFEDNWGDFRIKLTDNSNLKFYAEIYGTIVEENDDELYVPDINQKIRFYSLDGEEIIRRDDGSLYIFSVDYEIVSYIIDVK